MAYSFDEIKGAVTLLAGLYADVNAAELAARDGKPAVSRYVLKILGVLRQPLSDDDKRRFELVVDRIIETKQRAGRAIRSAMDAGDRAREARQVGAQAVWLCIAKRLRSLLA